MKIVTSNPIRVKLQNHYKKIFAAKKKKFAASAPTKRNSHRICGEKHKNGFSVNGKLYTNWDYMFSFNEVFPDLKFLRKVI